jgi:serine/threonine protein kinase/Tfp pilus assembly protein PilF
MKDPDLRHELLQRLFEEAQTLPAAERAAFVERRCGEDAWLKKRLTVMLAAVVDEGVVESSSSGELAPAASTPATRSLLGEGPGARIGPYTLLQQIGEGGFGSVFLAEQHQPVARKVALKIIKLGMDTRQVVARFEQERQALALMDHPNIARVIDAGATDTGRPYFVMELVDGSPIVEFCDTNTLSISERLALFAQVCGAVQHAHGKGIIHRDLKPSNILVSKQDGLPQPKVIDFGIAKATSRKLTDKTVYTEQQQVVGTLQYMSPEQAEGSLDIDTRTDVYALGILLYELLTGSTPFDEKTLKNAAYGDLQRMVREVEPPRPSTRLGESRETLLRIAAQRRSDPKQLSSLLRGELDWIVMKALEKDREQRYATANGLAMDVRRYLAGEAVVAAPPSAFYRLRKFVRRNRALASAGAAVAGALLLGVVAFAWQARVAAAERDSANLARGKEARQRQIAESERQLADEQRDRAMAAEREATKRAEELALVSEFQSSMLAQLDPTRAGEELTQDVMARFAAALSKAETSGDELAQQLESFRSQWGRINATDAALALIDRTIVEPAIDAIEQKFESQPRVAATLRATLGERYVNWGLHDAAKEQFDAALELRRNALGDEHPETLDSLDNLGVVLQRQGKSAEALRYHEEALEKRRRTLGEDHPSTLTSISNLGVALHHLGRSEEAMPYYREALEKRSTILGPDAPDTLSAISNIASFLWELDKRDEALVYYQEALEKRRRVLGEDHPDTLLALSNIGTALRDQGKWTEAVAHLREVLEKRRRILGDLHPQTLNSLRNLGSTLASAGGAVEGEALVREALANQQRVLGLDHPSTLISLNNLAAFLIEQGKADEAAPLCRESLERHRNVLGPNHPNTLVATSVLGYLLLRQGKPEEAEPHVREAIAISVRVNGEAHQATLTYIHNLGMLLNDQQKYAEAAPQFRTVVERGRSALGQANPITMSATTRLAGLLLREKNFAEAAELYESAEPDTRASANSISLASLLTRLGRCLSALGRFEEAEANFLEAHSLWLEARGKSHADTRNCVQAIVEHYTARQAAQPDGGHDAKLAQWKAEFDAAQ